MTWVDSIQELDFYSRGASDYCYCDLIIQPSDLTIQGIMSSAGAIGVPFLKIYLYSVDGVTEIADVTEHFEWYIAKITGRSFFTARLMYFPEIFCLNRCFILRAVVDIAGGPGFGDGQPSFNKFTQQYCLHDCCAVPAGVSITGGGIIQLATAMPDTVSSPVSPMCRPLLRMSVSFDCVDRYTGDYWKVPPASTYQNGTTTASGMFAFTKVLNLAGTVVDQPRDLKRVISLNNRVQRTEATRLYDVQSFEEFPTWKFQEISDMLHAPYLEINGRPYTFPGGTPFETLYPKRCGRRYFRLKFAVQDALQFQLFGCSDRCETDNLRYYAFLNQSSTYYDDAGRVIGSFDDLMDWFNTGGGGQYGGVPVPPPGGTAPADPLPMPWTARIVGPTEPVPDIAIDYFAVVEVTGDNLPTYIYGDTTRPSGRIYGQELINGDYNALFGVEPGFVPCAVPGLGDVTFYDMACAVPTIGTLEFIDACKLPVLGTPVYGDLDDVPTVPPGSSYFLLEDDSGVILTEDGDFLTLE